MRSGTNFVGGAWMDVGEARAVKSPFDGKSAGDAVFAPPSVVELASAAAARAQPTFGATSRYFRARLLERMAELVAERREELARTITAESGKPIQYSKVEVARCADTLKASADAARSLFGEEVPIDAARPGEGRMAFTRRFAIGPVASITPWNFPLNLVAHKVGPAIAAGCANVVKPASSTPLSALALADIAHEAGLPEGALSVVACDRKVGQRLVEDDRFKLLTFTGSSEVGWKMKREAGKKRVVLELGGNAALVALADADIDALAERAAIGGYYQAGQSCISVQRVIVDAKIYEKARDRIADRVRAIAFGDPWRDATVCGPLIDAENAARVEEWIEEAIGMGGRALVRGKREGAVVPPCLLEGVPKRARAVCEEIFGPVVVLERAESADEAIARAADTRFGLQCGVFTNDLAALMKAWDTIDVGAIIHNDAPAFRVDLMPYGGQRDSGLGREGPRYTIREMTEERMLVVKR